jgi:very-short-patch-repair endonuclease
MRLKARLLRHNQTDAERRLWSHLRNRQLGGFKFRRQYPIAPYIVDFACLEATLVIEVDGSQHMSQTHSDCTRDRFIERLGFRVIRFWDNDVLLRTEEVLEAIFQELVAPSPCARGGRSRFQAYCAWMRPRIGMQRRN